MGGGGGFFFSCGVKFLFLVLCVVHERHNYLTNIEEGIQGD